METIKNKFYSILAHKYAVIGVMILATGLSYLDRNYGFFFGLGLVFLLLRKNKYKWSEFGFGKKFTKNTIIQSIIYTVLITVLTYVCIEPFLEMYFGKMDLSSLDDIRGNFVGYVVLMLVMWVFAAFGEELLFHGYYMKKLAELLGDSDKAWFVSAILISVYFGASHNYQGTTGMISVGLANFFSALIFYKNRTNLTLLILIHGFYDSIGITLIYLNKDQVIYDWMMTIVN